MTDFYATEIINPNDRASKLAAKICQDSYTNNEAVTINPSGDHFRSSVNYTFSAPVLKAMSQNTMTQTQQNDGAGGKTQFATLVSTPDVFEHLGWEIITMTADDDARWGNLPIVLNNELCVRQITDENFHLLEALFIGYGKALKKAKLINVTGETAIMQHSITAFCDLNHRKQLVLTWGGSCIGLASKKNQINPAHIKPLLPIVGFYEPGYRCNGGTFFTRLIHQKFGYDIHDITQNPEAFSFAKQLCTPSKSYARTITRLNGWKNNGTMGDPLAEIHGIAHITGGGIWSKLGDLLPPGVGAHLHNMPKPAPVLQIAQKMSQPYPELRLSDHQAHGTFHGGCGMILVCPNETNANIVIHEAKKDDTQAQIIGWTTNSAEREIIIDSQFQEGIKLSSLTHKKK